MLDGRVTVNGATIRELGTKADPSSDDIRVDGRRVTLPERHRYLLLNKPRGFVTTRSDPRAAPNRASICSPAFVSTCIQSADSISIARGC